MAGMGAGGGVYCPIEHIKHRYWCASLRVLVVQRLMGWGSPDERQSMSQVACWLGACVMAVGCADLDDAHIRLLFLYLAYASLANSYSRTYDEFVTVDVTTWVRTELALGVVPGGGVT